MKQLCLAAVFIFASCALLIAQNSGGGNPPENQRARTSTIRGCLGGTAGAYTLASGGTMYELVGNDELLNRLVGKELKISGTRVSASDTSNGMPGDAGGSPSNPSGATEPTIKVSSATILADHCGSKN